MTDLTTVLPDCMMPDGAAPCEAFQRMQAERDRLRAAIDDALMMGITRDSYALIVSIRRRLQEALDHGD